MKKDVLFVYITQIISLFISVGSSIYLSRLLGTYNRGEVVLFNNSVAFAILLFGFSITSTIPYYLNNKKKDFSEIFCSSLLVVMVALVLLVLFLLILSRLGLLHIAIPNVSFFFIILFILNFIFQLINSIFTTTLNAIKKFKYVNTVNLIASVCIFFFYMLAYYKVIDVYNKVVIAVLLVGLAVVIINFILFFIMLKKHFNLFKFKLLPTNEFKTFLFFSVFAYLGNVATFVCYKLDFWFIDAYHGKSVLGYYSLASQLVQMLWILPQTISGILYTYVSHMDDQEALRNTILYAKIGFYATLLFSVIGVIMTHLFLVPLYGIEFEKSIKILEIQIIGVIPFSLPTIISSFYASRGNFKTSFYISVFVSVISVAMYWFLIPKFGGIGGAISSAITYFLGAFMTVVYFNKKYGVSLSSLLLIKGDELNVLKQLVKFKK